MSQPYLQSKQFTIWCDKCVMKVGTDGVLFGAWTSAKSSARTLDIGTGTGLVVLMLVQYSTASITTLKIDEAVTVQATENINRSPWKNGIEVIQQDFKHYSSKNGIPKSDIIVSNPPYLNTSLKCSNEQRNKACHNDNLTYEELLAGVSGLLSQEGAFTVVIPMDVGEQIKTFAHKYGLYPSRQLLIVTKPGGMLERTLISFRFTKQTRETEELLTETSRHQYSEKYIELTWDFYLKM